LARFVTKCFLENTAKILLRGFDKMLKNGKIRIVLSKMKRIKFLDCKIDFRNQVFRPRVETEFWVKKSLKELTEVRPLSVLDIFSGTGCIGISVLKNIKNSFVDFVDIEDAAIKQIKINLKLNNISKKRYKIYKSNLFEKLRAKSGRSSSSRCDSIYDVIFANPPYVALDRISEVQKEVLEKDPHVSLFAGKDGMDYIRRFFIQVKEFLEPNGKIFLEFDPFQKKKIKEILEKEKFKFIFKKDQFGKFRWLKAEAKK